MAQIPPSNNRRVVINRRSNTGPKNLDWFPNRSANLNSSSALSLQKSLFQKPRQLWENLGFRNKLTIFLLVGISISLLAITQITVVLTQRQAIADLDSSLKINLSLLEEDILLAQTAMEDSATALAKLVEISGINIGDPAQALAQQNRLEAVLGQAISINPNANLYFIIDSQGKPLAHHLQMEVRDFTQYPLLPETAIPVTNYQSVSPGEEFSFKEMPIVADVFSLKEPLKGVELFSGSMMQQLGLGRQAAIGIRQQQIAGLPELQQPFAEGTFDVDDGKAGLMLMAAVPIQVNGEMVGAAVLGTLINNNFELVDRLKQKQEFKLLPSLLKIGESVQMSPTQI